jgi:Poxvirus A32 protein
MMQPPFRLLVSARSQMGKTTLMIKLMLWYWLDMFETIYLFCPSYLNDEVWRVMDKHVESGKIVVHVGLKESSIVSLWKRLARQKEKNAKPVKHYLFYFDDCGDDPLFKKNDPKHVINGLAIRGNHDNISQVWCVQNLVLCSTIMRNNADGLLTFYIQADRELDYIHGQFGFGKKSDFKQLLQTCTAKKYDNFYVNRQGPGMADYYHNFNFLHISF